MSDHAVPQANSYPHETRGGSPATRGEAVTYNSRWTDHDRQIVTAELDRIRDRTSYFWRTESNAYIRATDAQGKALMYVEAGFLWWHDGRVEVIPDGAIGEDDFSYALSTTGLCSGCDE